jgi:hypothetical protein
MTSEFAGNNEWGRMMLNQTFTIGTCFHSLPCSPITIIDSLVLTPVIKIHILLCLELTCFQKKYQVDCNCISFSHDLGSHHLFTAIFVHTSTMFCVTLEHFFLHYCHLVVLMAARKHVRILL